MDHDKRIIRYLDGEMQEEELRLFEQELEKDPDLARQTGEVRKLQDLARKAVEAESDPETGLDEEIRREIRTAVQEFKDSKHPDQDIPPDFRNQIEESASAFFQKPSGMLKRIQIVWYSVAAVIIAGGLLSVILLRPFAKMSPADAYAEYFQTYNQTEEVTELTRSDDDFLFAVEVYESRDYERAVVLFQMLSDSVLTRDYALLYLGHSYMSLNQTEKAISSFENLIQTGNVELIDDAGWYLSLCYLKTARPERARELLEQISVSDSPYKSEAKRIIRSIR